MYLHARVRASRQDKHKRLAARAIGYLASDTAAAKELGVLGAVPCLLEMLRTGGEVLKEEAAFTLANLACDTENQSQVFRSRCVTSHTHRRAQSPLTPPPPHRQLREIGELRPLRALPKMAKSSGGRGQQN